MKREHRYFSSCPNGDMVEFRYSCKIRLAVAATTLSDD